MVRGARVLAVAAMGTLAAAVPSEAQERDSIPGVSLGLVYEAGYQPALAVQPFTGRFGGLSVAPRVEAIIARDLRYSDRFQVLDSLPTGLVGEGVDYTLWDRMGAVWLVSGQVEGAGDRYVLILELHDVLYAEVRERGRFPLPDPEAEDFRMAIHRISDQVVEWITGEPGMAATRIVFNMPTTDGAKELFVIDSDGENLQQITRLGSLTMSPAWHPSGTKIAFNSFASGEPRIHELDLTTGESWLIPPARKGQHMTPAYHPDGRTLAFSVVGGDRSGLFSYDVERHCCVRYLSGGRWYDLSPTYSPSGDRIAFNSERFGSSVPQIMLMDAEGGGAETLSPYEYGSGGYFTSPDWAPTGDLVAFHGAVRRGTHHILVADLRDGGRVLRQLTWEGNNEDPSWAPDGRHLVFVGTRQWGYGLFVVDVATRNLRALVTGRRVGLPDWSPPLGPQR